MSLILHIQDPDPEFDPVGYEIIWKLDPEPKLSEKSDTDQEKIIS